MRAQVWRESIDTHDGCPIKAFGHDKRMRVAFTKLSSKRFALLSLSLSLFSTSFSQNGKPATTDWPMFRGNPQNTGAAIGTLPENP
jgi:hypothetical protein